MNLLINLSGMTTFVLFPCVVVAICCDLHVNWKVFFSLESPRLPRAVVPLYTQTDELRAGVRYGGISSISINNCI